MCVCEREREREAMESPLAGNKHSIQEKVIEELVHGRGLAAQLQIILHELTGFGRESATAEDLVTKILRSFTEALSPLSSSDSGKFRTSSSCRDRRRIREENPTSKDQSRKRAKKRNIQETWTRITSIPFEDGYAWRKYGQKEILNAKHLRCYYRCTYRFDHGCQAAKQVQRTEDEKPRFRTKYMGHHTCQDVLKASFILDSTAEEGVLLNFELHTTTKQEPIFFSSFPSSKEERKKSFPPIEHEYNPSSSEYHPPQYLTKFKTSTPTSTSPSTSKMGHEDFVSGGSSSSSCSFDMDMELIDSFYFSDVFYDEELF